MYVGNEIIVVTVRNGPNNIQRLSASHFNFRKLKQIKFFFNNTDNLQFTTQRVSQVGLAVELQVKLKHVQEPLMMQEPRMMLLISL